MNVLLIYAHPYDKSFNAGIKNALVQRLESEGHTVRVRDLYEDRFNPYLEGSDLLAFRKGEFPDDISAEHEHLKWADHWIFVSPIWWASFPAALKGWMDRSFSYGFAYKMGESGLEKLLTGKKAFIVSTAGTPEPYYDEAWKAIGTLHHAVFGFFGVETSEDHHLSGATSISQEDREAFIAKVSDSASAWLK